MSLDTRPEAPAPIRSDDELFEPFRAAFKPRERHRVGLEHETIGIDALSPDGLAPIPYQGPRGIRALLARFERFGFLPFLERGHPIALLSGATQISLEPGGQLELAGAPATSALDVAREQAQHMARLRALGHELGLRFLSIGLRPAGTVQRAEWMPKARYEAMRKVLPACGPLALEMMLMTASAQVSVDFAGEADLAHKVAVASAASPLVTALCASSPFAGGKPSGYLSTRAHVWDEVDPHRCGALPFAQSFTLERYVDWALDVPMLFIRRHGSYLTPGMTFRRFFAEGAMGERATPTDWVDHLTTLFPDVRVKQVLELRTADAAGADLAAAIVALWKGVLYDPTARTDLADLLAQIPERDGPALREAAAREALSGRVGAFSLLEGARALVAIARQGLVRQGCTDEASLLDPLEEIASTGMTRAERLLRAFERGGLRAVIERAAV